MSNPINGIFAPPKAHLVLAYSVTTYPCIVDRIELYAGAAIGSAQIRFPASAADSVMRNMGDRAKILIGGETVFSGCIGYGPFEVNPDQDEIQLVIFDVKWRMSSNKLGQPGIGTVVDPADATKKIGFTDVGYELIFNKDGRPNCNAAGTDFNLAATATFWTLKNILKFVFDHYVPAGVAALELYKINRSSWDRKPANLNLFGMSPVQAIDALAQFAGESWTISPLGRYVAVVPGSGTQRFLRLYAPGLGSVAMAATENYVSDINAALSIQNCRDVFHVFSGNIIKETTYWTDPGDAQLVKNNQPPVGLLIDAGPSPVSGYARRFRVNVTKYSAHGLGRDRVAGATVKPWLPKLITRLKPDNTYASASEIVTTPNLEQAEHVRIPVWLSLDGTLANAKLLGGGFKINIENGIIDFEEKPESISPDDRTKKKEIPVTEWWKVGIWMTVATVLETFEIKSSNPNAVYLPEAVTEIIRRNDLVPERREKVCLPKLTGTDPHAMDTIAATAEEKYINVTSRIDDTLAAIVDSSPEVECPITATLPFFPIWAIGDRVKIMGRSSGATGKEVITKIQYGVYEQYETRIEATNVMISVDPERFVGRHQ